MVLLSLLLLLFLLLLLLANVDGNGSSADTKTSEKKTDQTGLQHFFLRQSFYMLLSSLEITMLTRKWRWKRDQENGRTSDQHIHTQSHTHKFRYYSESHTILYVYAQREHIHTSMFERMHTYARFILCFHLVNTKLSSIQLKVDLCWVRLFVCVSKFLCAI